MTGNTDKLPKGLTLIKEWSNLSFNSGLIAVLPILLLVFPDVTYGLPRRRIHSVTSGGSKEKSEEPALTKVEPPETETTDSYFKDLAVQIINAFEIDQIFLKPELSADELGEKLSAPRHHIYYCLNTVIGEKFTSLKAKYRVRHAQKLLIELDLNRYTIDSIGLSSGFSSRSSFYAAFREITGITPSDFLTQNGRSAVNQ